MKLLLQISENIRVGSTDNRQNGSVVAVKRLIRHEKYNASITDFDFALLELAEPLNFSDTVQPVTLPEADYEIDDGKMCHVSGWGNIVLKIIINLEQQ